MLGKYVILFAVTLCSTAPAQGGCWDWLFRHCTKKKQTRKHLYLLPHEAITYFTTTKTPHNAVVIFDVDDTAIDIENKVLPDVYQLYSKLIELEISIIFLSARPTSTSYYEDYVAYTKKILHQAGYKIIHNLICMPTEIRAKIRGNIFKSAVARWKEEQRCTIAQNYTIIGCVDDCEENLKGEHVGTPVLIEPDDYDIFFK